ncbi:HNH endonuclease [Rhodoferax sp. U11-2br]|uniref:HNH endonuclease n=1 Tax=Rhodoferax sp. U11-2br TaxID=2838878 RepID=UPI001BEAE65F|nr:HNH endonuclease [Rhodoferax sp. U11-2br]MBT3067172.1 HNH endonuclease [Rhodoferax sp. U11-2br]
MDERVVRTIAGLRDWAELQAFTKNAAARDRLTPDVKEALDQRSVELGRELMARKTGLDLTSLSAAEQKIVLAVSQYVALKEFQSSHATRTFDQLRNRGLIGAAESAVCRGSPTEGFRTLAEANHSDISYEQIVVDHTQEFSERAIWYSRRALGMPNTLSNPPAQDSSDIQTKTTSFIAWLKKAAKINDGIIPLFTNDEAAAAIGRNDMQKYGRAHGNMQSRIDFACYRVELPPLGLAAEEPFELAWSQDRRTWAFPVMQMQRAAQLREWTDQDFDRVLRETERLPGQAHLIWKDAFAKEEQAIQAWAYSFSTEEITGEDIEESRAKRNAIWSRDELILALDLYMRHRASPPARDSLEIEELSEVLNQLGTVLGQRINGTYRNTNGVYMKLMNFRRLDPDYTAEGKKGLTRGNQDEARVWDQFAVDPARLAEVARFIRKGITEHLSDENLAGPDETGIEEAEEGKVATRMHRYRERDRRLVVEAKVQAMKKHGRLVCSVCNFDFSKRYGDVGANIIDVHHTKPVHTLEPGEKTKVTDLVLLCSNCHRVVHSRRTWLSVEQVKTALANASARGQ